MRTSTSRSSADGFTLIEVLAAITIIAVVAGLAMASFTRRGANPSLGVIATETASRARAVRDHAVRTGQEALLLIDVEGRSIYARGGARPFAIPRDVPIEVVSSASERVSGSIAGIRFFPDGASTGAVIKLGPAGQAHEVRINWFTGRVAVSPPP